MVLLVTVSVPSVKMPPPRVPVAELPLMVLLVTVSVPSCGCRRRRMATTCHS